MAEKITISNPSLDMVIFFFVNSMLFKNFHEKKKQIKAV